MKITSVNGKSYCAYLFHGISMSTVEQKIIAKIFGRSKRASNEDILRGESKIARESARE